MIESSEMVFVSSVSLWEIAIKARLGKMSADAKELFAQIEVNRLHELPVWSRHALVAADLPLHHTDPFDRLLVAQAMSEPLHLLTPDPTLERYSDLVVVV